MCQKDNHIRLIKSEATFFTPFGARRFILRLIKHEVNGRYKKLYTPKLIFVSAPKFKIATTIPFRMDTLRELYMDESKTNKINTNTREGNGVKIPPIVLIYIPQKRVPKGYFNTAL